MPDSSSKHRGYSMFSMGQVRSWRQVRFIVATLLVTITLQGCAAFAIPAVLGAAVMVSEQEKKKANEEAPPATPEAADLEEPELDWRDCFQKEQATGSTGSTIFYAGAAAGAFITLIASMSWGGSATANEDKEFRQSALIFTGVMAATGVGLDIVSNQSHYINDSQFCRAVRTGKATEAGPIPAQ